MTEVRLRPATPEDAAALAELGRQTFIESYSSQNTPEDMNAYIAQTFGTEKQLRELKDPALQIELAFVDGELAGFVQLHDGRPDANVTGPRPIEVLRIYVLKKWQGRRVGKALLDRGIALAREQGYLTMWLGVWEHNHGAQAFYKTYGFEKVGEHVFKLGSAGQNDYILSRRL